MNVEQVRNALDFTNSETLQADQAPVQVEYVDYSGPEPRTVLRTIKTIAIFGQPNPSVRIVCG